MVWPMGALAGPLPLFGAFALFFGVIGCLELGRAIGRWRHAADPAISNEGSGAVEGAVYGLLGLLVAFAFSGALTRWEGRIGYVVEEANDIGTAWLRIDLLPEPAQPALRDLFRQYLDARIAAYEAIQDGDAEMRGFARATELQHEIWQRAVAECLKPEGERARLLLLPALNAMIDITTTRTVAMLTHPPAVVYVLLVGLLLASSLMSGLAMATSPHRHFVRMACFALAMSVGVYVIFDLEFPRLGLIRIDAIDQVLRDLRASMN
jgi:hypothetical protein